VTGILTVSRKVMRGEAVPEPQGFLDFLAAARGFMRRQWHGEWRRHATTIPVV